MSADNYLHISGDARVFMRFASDDAPPKVEEPLHVASSVPDAIAWANEYMEENYVEYGCEISDDAVSALKQQDRQVT